MKNIVCGLLASIFLCGCEQFPLRMSDQPTAAKLRFIVDVEEAWLDIYPQDDCTTGMNIVTNTLIAKVESVIRSPTPPRVGMLDPVSPNARNVAEYAVDPTQIVNVGGGSVARCIGGHSFAVDPGGQYEIRFLRVRTECRLQIVRLHEDGPKVVRVPVDNLQEMICKRPEGAL